MFSLVPMRFLKTFHGMNLIWHYASCLCLNSSSLLLCHSFALAVPSACNSLPPTLKAFSSSSFQSQLHHLLRADFPSHAPLELLLCVLRSVVSASWCPRGLQPTMLLCACEFPREVYWGGLTFPPPGMEASSVMSPALTDGFFTAAPSALSYYIFFTSFSYHLKLLCVFICLI